MLRVGVSKKLKAKLFNFLKDEIDDFVLDKINELEAELFDKINNLEYEIPEDNDWRVDELESRVSDIEYDSDNGLAVGKATFDDFRKEVEEFMNDFEEK
jgi:hypothetical protein